MLSLKDFALKLQMEIPEYSVLYCETPARINVTITHPVFGTADIGINVIGQEIPPEAVELTAKAVRAEYKKIVLQRMSFESLLGDIEVKI